MFDKGFTQIRSLKDHKSLHTRGKPKSCDICNKAVSKNSDLTRHKDAYMREFITIYKTLTLRICIKIRQDLKSVNDKADEISTQFLQLHIKNISWGPSLFKMLDTYINLRKIGEFV